MEHRICPFLIGCAHGDVHLMKHAKTLENLPQLLLPDFV